MSQKTNYLENAIVNAVLRNTTYTSPATVYLALHTADPTEVGNVAEVATGSYARTAIAFAAPSNGAVANSGTVTFPTASADWGTVTHFTIWDASSGGNCLYYGTLTASKSVPNGATASFAASSVTVTES